MKKPLYIFHGSVKDIELLEFPSSKSLGYAVLVFRPSYSIKDLKKMPDEIPGRESLCAIAAHGFEWLESNGIFTHYEGVEGKDGKPTNLDRLDSPPTRMHIRFANVHPPEFSVKDGKPSYSYKFYEENRGKLNHFLVPIEWIYRNGLPKGSSILKELNEAKEKGDSAFIENMLKKLGLSSMPEPNTMLPRPYANHTTKLEDSDRSLGDDYGDNEALYISGLTKEQFQRIKSFRNKIANLNKELGAPVGINVWDGKIEIIWSDRPVLGDVSIGPDECRLFYKGVQVSKEFLRQIYDKYQPELNADIKRAQTLAKEEAIKTGKYVDWRKLLRVHPKSLNEIDPRLIPLTGEMHMALANKLTRREFYPKAPSLDAVVEELEYYSKK